MCSPARSPILTRTHKCRGNSRAAKSKGKSQRTLKRSKGTRIKAKTKKDIGNLNETSRPESGEHVEEYEKGVCVPTESHLKAVNKKTGKVSLCSSPLHTCRLLQPGVVFWW